MHTDERVDYINKKNSEDVEAKISKSEKARFFDTFM
jgi:hypothetical protein